MASNNPVQYAQGIKIIGILLFYAGGIGQGFVLGVVLAGNLGPFPFGWQLICIALTTTVAVGGALLMECGQH